MIATFAESTSPRGAERQRWLSAASEDRNALQYETATPINRKRWQFATGEDRNRGTRGEASRGARPRWSFVSSGS